MMHAGLLFAAPDYSYRGYYCRGMLNDNVTLRSTYLDVPENVTTPHPLHFPLRLECCLTREGREILVQSLVVSILFALEELLFSCLGRKEDRRGKTRTSSLPPSLPSLVFASVGPSAPSAAPPPLPSLPSFLSLVLSDGFGTLIVGCSLVGPMSHVKPLPIEVQKMFKFEF